LPSPLTAAAAEAADVGPELVDDAKPGPSPVDVLIAPAGVFPLTVMPVDVEVTDIPNP
jgi:hypothetical protein